VFLGKGAIVVNNNRLMGFLIGLTLGGAASVLFAPMAGKKTRRLIAEKVDRGKDSIERSGTAVLDSATDLLDDGKRSFKRASDAMTATVEAWRGVVHPG
jgi:gas vesicle protein